LTQPFHLLKNKQKIVGIQLISDIPSIGLDDLFLFQKKISPFFFVPTLQSLNFIS